MFLLGAASIPESGLERAPLRPAAASRIHETGGQCADKCGPPRLRQDSCATWRANFQTCTDEARASSRHKTAAPTPTSAPQPHPSARQRCAAAGPVPQRGLGASLARATTRKREQDGQITPPMCSSRPRDTIRPTACSEQEFAKDIESHHELASMCKLIA